MPRRNSSYSRQTEGFPGFPSDSSRSRRCSRQWGSVPRSESPDGAGCYRTAPQGPLFPLRKPTRNKALRYGVLHDSGPCCIGCVFGKSARRGLARGGGCRRLVRHEWLPLSSRFACSIPRPIVRALRRGRQAMPHRASFAFCRARPTGGRQSSAGLKPRRTRRVSVPEHDLVRRVHGLDVGTRRKMVAPLAGVADELDR